MNAPNVGRSQMSKPRKWSIECRHWVSTDELYETIEVNTECNARERKRSLLTKFDLQLNLKCSCIKTFLFRMMEISTVLTFWLCELGCRQSGHTSSLAVFWEVGQCWRNKTRWLAANCRVAASAGTSRKTCQDAHSFLRSRAFPIHCTRSLLRCNGQAVF